MMPPLTGTSNGQDYYRRAALKMATGDPQGGQQGQAMPAPPASTPMAKRLLEIATETIRDLPNFEDNMASWKQALLYIGQNMPQQGQQGPAAIPAGGGPDSPSMMGEMGAQAAPGMYGRPPR